MEHSFFNRLEKKTGVKMNEVMRLAESLKGANFKQEDTIRSIIQQVSDIANKPVTKELEDKIVATLTKQNETIDMATISNLIQRP